VLRPASDKNSGSRSEAAVFLGAVANRILKLVPPPDLRGSIIVLPNYHVAKSLARALSSSAKAPALLLPRMVTLNDWAQTISPEGQTISDSLRAAILYQQLRRQKWFDQAELWSMTHELLSLFDELTYSLNDLPGDESAFVESVMKAYQSRQNGALQLEARLVFELWYAMQQGNELDPVRVYQQRLARLAMQAHQPLFVLRTTTWNAMEQRFLDEYSKKAPVEIFDLRHMDTMLGNTLSGESIDLRSRSIKKLDGRIRFHGATSMEREARAAAMQIRLWLASGKRDIAVVTQDRVVARRLRALLERVEVQVEDETGWTFATLSVSTVIDRWLTALQSDFYHQDLLDLLKSPFIFADLAAGDRKSAVYQLEQLLRKHGVVSGLENFIAIMEQGSQLAHLLLRLKNASVLLGHGKRRNLANWLVALSDSLNKLAIDKGLQQDAAGQQLLKTLEARQQDLSSDQGQYLFAEWRQWLSQELDTQTYCDTGIDSSVRFTHLAATRWRCFDAVLLLGCDTDHLPGKSDGGRWFNDSVRFALDLPTRSDHTARQRDDLLALLAMNDSVLVTWQKDRNGEVGLLSPYLEILRDLHEITYGDDLSEKELHACLDAEDAHVVDLPQAAQPAPGVPNELVPENISISGYNSLVACPYQYYARNILRLNELDEVQEAVEKSDYGERVHEILRRFHEHYPHISEYSEEELESALREISEQMFADLLKQDFTARAWLARWYKSLPSYLEWQAENESNGWKYTGAEIPFGKDLENIHLRGRVDRLDVRSEEKIVLDYKTQSDQVLRNKLKEPGEDVQLACYAYEHEATEAAFVSIENGKVRSVSPKDDIAQLARLNIERLEQLASRIRAGDGMPANGIDHVCQYCEIRGICRKGHWGQEQ